MLLSLLLPSVISQSQPTAFRAVFEDRPRQLIVMLKTDTPQESLGFIFHPEIGTIRKVWLGKTDYRGKVYDFSQNNSRSEGRTLWESKSECIRLEDSATSSWKREGVEFNAGWRFTKDRAWIESPPFRYDGLQTAYVGFDELSQTARFQISLLNELGKVGTQFGSSMAQDSSWQWNFKRIPILPGEWRIRVAAEKANDKKALRNLRVFGDFPAWYVLSEGKPEPAEVRFQGYRIQKGVVTATVSVEGAIVEWTPTTDGKQSWSETFTVKGLRGRDSLLLDRGIGEPLTFKNETRTVKHTW